MQRLIITVLVGAGLAAAVLALGYHPVKVVSSSMAPAIDRGDWVVVHDGSGGIERGDVVLFRFPLGTDGRAVKRIIATAGDKVEIRPGEIVVNGRSHPLAGSPNAESARPRTEVVPDGAVYLVGDHSAHSIDSRTFGAVPVKEIVGRVVLSL